MCSNTNSHFDLKESLNQMWMQLSCLFCFSEPPSFKKELQMVEVVKGTTAVFECEITGTAPFEVTWCKNKRSISSDKKHNIISNDSKVILEIYSFESADIGDYQCFVSNDVGKISCKSTGKLKG